MNYYEVLNVEEGSSQNDIKKSYRKLSLEHHPDKNNNSKESNDNFQRISEAYETLGDEDKRKIYDNERKMKSNFGNFHGSGSRNPFMNEHEIFNMFSMFDNNFNGFMNRGGPNIRIFRNGVHVNHMNKEDLTVPVSITLEESYHGKNKEISIKRNIYNLNDHSKSDEREIMNISIPKGIDNNEFIVIEKKGNKYIQNSNDIYSNVKIIFLLEKNNVYKREGVNLIYVHKISLKEALCGFKIEVDHINGNKYTINNKEGNIINPNYYKEIENLGMTKFDKCGKLIIKFIIEFPLTLTLEQIHQLSSTL